MHCFGKMKSGNIYTGRSFKCLRLQKEAKPGELLTGREGRPLTQLIGSEDGGLHLT